MCPPKKPKKHYDILCKCRDVWTTQFPWAETLISEREIHHVKCMVCSFVKDKGCDPRA